ncbi:hypothetical protein JWG44_09935 [Leptospira sp. 201903071]|uniref:LIC10906 family membrane protein n=1 Tax=Leptospira ainazelensis TaxID=2810034 RepID=UPI0019657A72|nr:histidine kinase N-terminal 7TM domain-containing protein [Leptospira ainazelensis]MBM9500565.1 hypothetical protein [Leptospira ainazelensis]
MNPNIFFPILTGLLHFSFGVYVFRLKPKQHIQGSFLILSLLLSMWLMILGFREFLPISYRNIALNITFLPISFAPFVLYYLCSKLENPRKKIPIWAIVTASFGQSYIVFTCISQNMATLKDPENFIFDFNANYHILVLYLVFWVVLSIYTVTRKMVIQRGEFKVRLFLVLIGALLALPLTTLFVYFLPLLGFYKPYLSSIGLIISSIFWAVAILHYDAFRIKSGVLKGEKVTFINRLASGGFLKLLQKLDPMRFIQKRSKEKAEITKEILIHDYNLAINRGELSVEKRAEILSKKFGKYFK